jgi:hypothetical protein
MSYDRFIPANYHGKKESESEASTQGFQIIPRICYCDFKASSKKKKCGRAFKSTAPNAHTCPEHRAAARKQQAKRYAEKMKAKMRG